MRHQNISHNAQKHNPAPTRRPPMETHIGISRWLILTCQRRAKRRAWTKATSPKMTAETMRNACWLVMGIYLIPRQAASSATRFAASLRDRLRVSCRKRIAFSRSPVLTNP